jgi:pyridoxine 4-dehydrogenase
VLDYCTQNNIIFIPWFPLRDVNGEPALQAKLQPIADKYNVNYQQLVLAWLLKKSPMMLPIPGTLSIGHLRDNIAATEIQLSDADYTQLDSF